MYPGTPPVADAVSDKLEPSHTGDVLPAVASNAGANPATIAVPSLIRSVPAELVAPHPYKRNVAV